MARQPKRSRQTRVQRSDVPRSVSQTREERIYRYWLSLKRDREFQHGYRKGWYRGPYMQIAIQFRTSIREVKEIIEAKRGHNGGDQ